MPANSLPRRLAKTILAPITGEKFYRWMQACAMAWDIKSGGWVDKELELLPSFVRPGETALDIGANYGLYAFHLQKAVGPTGKVYAFEPLPFTASTFKIVARLAGFTQVELIEKGAGLKNETVSFTVPIQKNGAIAAGLTHLGNRNNERDGKKLHFQFERTKQVPCEIIVIDDYLPHLENVSFIKCDIEGADYFALKGTQKIIKKNLPTIFCEIDPWFMRGYGIAVKDLVQDFLGALGYKPYKYLEGKLIPATIEGMLESEKTRGGNWFFIHPSRIDRAREYLQSPTLH